MIFLSSRGIHSVNRLREVVVGVKLSNIFFNAALLKMPLLYSTVWCSITINLNESCFHKICSIPIWVSQ